MTYFAHIDDHQIKSEKDLTKAELSSRAWVLIGTLSSVRANVRRKLNNIKAAKDIIGGIPKTAKVSFIDYWIKKRLLNKYTQISKIAERVAWAVQQTNAR